MKSLISASLCFFKIIFYEGPNIMTSTQKGGEEVLKFVTCLWILLILNNIYCSFLWIGGWVKKLVIFCGRHKCMIPNVKEVTFLDLVPALQPSSLLSICMFKMKGNLKTFLIFKNGTKTSNCKSLFLSKYYLGKKTKVLPRTTTFI